MEKQFRSLPLEIQKEFANAWGKMMNRNTGLKKPLSKYKRILVLANPVIIIEPESACIKADYLKPVELLLKQL